MPVQEEVEEEEEGVQVAARALGAPPPPHAAAWHPAARPPAAPTAGRCADSMGRRVGLGGFDGWVWVGGWVWGWGKCAAISQKNHSHGLKRVLVCRVRHQPLPPCPQVPLGVAPPLVVLQQLRGQGGVTGTRCGGSILHETDTRCVSCLSHLGHHWRICLQKVLLADHLGEAASTHGTWLVMVAWHAR